jgi:hypothetical protein
MMKKTGGNLAKKFAIGIGLALIFPMLIHYGVRTFSPPPHWEDYAVPNFQGKYEMSTPEERAQLQERQYQLEQKRRNHEKKFEKHLFIVAVPFGILAILVGAFTPLQAIGAGLMFGGILSLLDGYINYWSELPDIWRFLSLLIGFFVLLVVGYRQLSKN